MKIRDVKAHCDIPCAVYDPGVAQNAALSVVRFLDLITSSLFINPGAKKWIINGIMIWNIIIKINNKITTLKKTFLK